MAQISGVVENSKGEPVARTIRFYRRDTGAPLGNTISSADTGQYTFTTSYLEEVQVVMVNSIGSSIENDQIKRVIPA